MNWKLDPSIIQDVRQSGFPVSSGTAFAAKYAGKCHDCGGYFAAGDMIMAVAQDTQTHVKFYAHAVEDEHLDPAKLKPTKFEGTTLDQMGF